MIQYEKILTRSEFADSTFCAIPEHSVFFDIETTGLSPESAGIYCIGCGFVNTGKPMADTPRMTGTDSSCKPDPADEEKRDSEPFFCIRLFFAQSPAGEGEILTAASDLLSRFDTLITFNGTTFDLPFVRRRIELAGRPEAVRSKYTGSDKAEPTLPQHDAAKKTDEQSTKHPGKKQLPRHTDPFSHMRHIDLYREIRRLKKLLGLSSCRQKACEAFLGIGRDDQYSGGELISVYHSYVRRQKPHLLHLLLLHNCEDVKGMADLCSLLSYGRALGGEFEVESCTPKESGAHPEHGDPASAQSCPLPGQTGRQVFLKVVLVCPAAFPKEISGSKPCLRETSSGGNTTPPAASARCTPAAYRFSGRRLTLWFPLFHGTLKYFFPDPENYYYLPQEDMAVHKSVGAYVDPAYRVRAVKKTCYTKKECDYICIPEEKKKTKNPCRSLRLEYADGLSILCIPPWIAGKAETASAAVRTAGISNSRTEKTDAAGQADSSSGDDPGMSRFFGELKEWLTVGLEHWLLSS